MRHNFSLNNISQAAKLTLKFTSVVFQKSEHVFLVSHMRSRSSLLSHILGSNSEIAGHNELHQSYINNFDFFKSKIKILSEEDIQMFSKRIFFDKVLHNHLQLPLNQMCKRGCKMIFMVREPVSSVMSIAKILELNPTNTTIEKATRYYLDRLDQIEKMYIAYPKELSFFIDSDQIVKNPQAELNLLTEWLSLSNPLSENYQLFKSSGKKGYGDFSSNILGGRIIKKTNSYNFKLPDDLKTDLESRYFNFIESKRRI